MNKHYVIAGMKTLTKRVGKVAYNLAIIGCAIIIALGILARTGNHAAMDAVNVIGSGARQTITWNNNNPDTYGEETFKYFASVN